MQEIRETQPDKFLRTEVFEFSSKVNPFKLVTNKENFIFPFTISRNSAILVGRNFSNRRSAAGSGSFKLSELPINVENAEKLEVGDYVAIPVETTILASYSGQTLTSVFQKSGLLKELVSASAFESYGGAVQGSIVGNGEFTMHIVKVAPHRVRVRISTGNSLVLSGGGSLSAGGNVNIKFLPHSVLERGRDLRRTLKRIRNRLNGNLGQVSFEKSWELLNPNQKRLMDDKAWSLKLDFLSQLKSLSGRGDPALSNMPGSDQGEDRVSLELLNKAKDRVVKQGSEWIDRIVKVSEDVDKIRAHSFNLSANVSLNQSQSRVLNSLGEYIFDLTSEEGRIAFLHAVSGRSKWLGDDVSGFWPAPVKNDAEFKALSDFTIAEKIAVEDQLSNVKRVERVQLADAKKEKSVLNIQFNFANAQMGFLQDRSKNIVRITDLRGQATQYHLQTSRFQKKAFYAGRTDNEVKSSGFYSKSAGDVLASYYYSWNYEKSHQPSALREPLKHLLNVLGPEFYRSKAHLLWPVNCDGSISSHLEIVINQSGISRFFDESVVKEDDLWVAFGQIAGSWDNTFGLPFNASGGLSSPNPSEEAIKACTIISKEWGGGYCKYISEVFIPKWRATEKMSGVEQVRFFSEFYQQGFLANKIGADLMMRLVLQVLGNTRKDSSVQDYMLKIQSTPKEVMNANQIIDYEFGSDPLHSVSEALGLKMLML